MACRLLVPWDDALTGYDFGPGHPLAPIRVELTMELARSFGVLGDVMMTVPEPATQHELELVHDREYIEAVRRAGETGRPDVWHGLGTSDDPVFPRMHEA